MFCYVTETTSLQSLQEIIFRYSLSKQSQFQTNMCTIVLVTYWCLLGANFVTFILPSYSFHGNRNRGLDVFITHFRGFLLFQSALQTLILVLSLLFCFCLRIGMFNLFPVCLNASFGMSAFCQKRLHSYLSIRVCDSTVSPLTSHHATIFFLTVSL